MNEARFIGDPRNDGDGPAVLALWDHSFPKGEWVGVTDAGLFARLVTNNHFETRTGKAAKAAEPVKQDDPDLVIPQRGAPEPVVSEVPANWRELHHSTRIRLAKSLDADLADTITTAADADQLIEWHIEGKDIG